MHYGGSWSPPGSHQEDEVIQGDISDILPLEPRAMELLGRDLIVDIARRVRGLGEANTSSRRSSYDGCRGFCLPWNLKRHQHFTKYLGWRQLVFVHCHGRP